MSHVYFVYILASLSGTLYVGYTSNLQRRRAQHSIGGSTSAFTARYKVDRLVYFETYTNIQRAQSREKQIKGWRREKKIALIMSMNPSWRDLSKTLLGHPLPAEESVREKRLLERQLGTNRDSSPGSESGE